MRHRPAQVTASFAPTTQPIRMAPLRPAPTTALPVMRQLGPDLAKGAREVWLLSAATGLSECVDGLLAATHDDAIGAQLLIDERGDASGLDEVARRMQGRDLLIALRSRDRISHADPATGTAWRFRVDAPSAPHGRAAGTLRPSIVIATRPSSDPSFMEGMGEACDDCPVLFRLGDASETTGASRQTTSTAATPRPTSVRLATTPRKFAPADLSRRRGPFGGVHRSGNARRLRAGGVGNDLRARRATDGVRRRRTGHGGTGGSTPASVGQTPAVNRHGPIVL